MNSVQPLLTCRNADLADMVALLQRQHDAKLDVVVPARDLRMVDGDLHIDGIGEPVLTLDGVTPACGVFRPTLTCDGGIADKLGIPSQYLRRMREMHPGLLDDNVNTWLADDPGKRYLIRALRGDGAGLGLPGRCCRRSTRSPTISMCCCRYSTGSAAPACRPRSRAAT